MQKYINHFKKHPRLLLALLVLVTACGVYHQYLFGGYVFLFGDIGSDTSEQYIMQYSSIVNHIRNGNFSLWDSTNGFGTSMYQLNLFNPALWLIYLPGILFGPQVMPGCLIYVHILILLLASHAAWGFLSCFSFSAKAKLVACYLYAFNGFLTVWGQHYQFGIILVFLPLLLMFLEKALQKKRFSLLVPVCTGLMVLCSYYLSYMVLIVAGVYLILRILLIQKEGFSAFIRTLALQCAGLLLGVGMGLLNLLPSFAMVFQVSARMGSDQGLLERCIQSFSLYPDGYYNTLIHKLLSGNLQGIGSAVTPYQGYANYYEAPNLFFSSLFLILFVQFLFAFPRIRECFRKKLVWGVAVAAGIFCLTIMFGSLVFNAFSYPFSRHTFLFMPFFAMLVAYMLDYIMVQKRFSLVGGLLSVCVTTAIYLPAALCAATTVFLCNAAILCITAFGMVCLLLLLSRAETKKYQSAGFLLLCLAVGLNVASDTYTTVAGRGYVQKGTAYFENLYGQDFQELTAYLKETDPSFYRMEKDYAAGSQCMDSLGQYYRGISTYNSTANKNILEFVEKILPEFRYVNSAHMTFRQISGENGYAALFGIKYLISQNAALTDPDYRFVRSFGNLHLYENERYSGFAQFYTRTVSSASFEAYEAEGHMADTESLLSQCLITEDGDMSPEALALLASCTYEPVPDMGIDSAALPHTVLAGGDGSLSWNVPAMALPLNSPAPTGGKTTAVFDISVNGSFDIAIRTSEQGVPYIATVTGGQPSSVTLTIPEGTDTLYITTDSPTLTTGISNLRFYHSDALRGTQNAAITMEDTGKDSLLTCTAAVPEDGLLFLPIPYEAGWKATVDGQETKLTRADYGFTAIPLTAGNHNITLTYHQPLLKEALLLTLTAWLLYLALIFLTRKKRGRCEM